MKKKVLKRYNAKEISWLSFNERVLQEARDKNVPLIDRLRFLGIFSSNQDEFYRVRVAAVRRLTMMDKKSIDELEEDPHILYKEIQKEVKRQAEIFDETYAELLKLLEAEGIYMVDDRRINKFQREYLQGLFQRSIRSFLFPIIVDEKNYFPTLKDASIYLAVEMTNKDQKRKLFSLVEIPRKLPRFYQLPTSSDKRVEIIFLDDIIRLCLPQLFQNFAFDSFKAYVIKLTRDSELEVDDDLYDSFFEKFQTVVKKRKIGRPVRFTYDEEISPSLLKLLNKRLSLQDSDDNIPGSRYHNFKDLMKFPALDRPKLNYKRIKPMVHPELKDAVSILEVIAKRDVLLHFPYQSFEHVIDLLREAAIDTQVISVSITIYRLAENSNVINALINAARNGKKVVVILELQARFDEEANMEWAEKLNDEGVTVIFGVKGLKIHSKLCLVRRKEGRSISAYAAVGTGNFNEDTAKVYTDQYLFTASKRITGEVEKVFTFLQQSYSTFSFRHLLVAPFNLRKKMEYLIRAEMAHAKAGRSASIFLKVNNLADFEMIDILYEAGKAGVKIRLLIRGMYSLIAGKKDLSENIEAISIVGKFLEHSRLYLFENGGHRKLYISSGDCMARNLDRRVEVACPIYNPTLQQELVDYLEIHWKENCKARILDEDLSNEYRKNPKSEASVNAQEAFYRYLKQKSSPPKSTETDLNEDSDLNG